MKKVTPAMLGEFARRRLDREPCARIAADHGVTDVTVGAHTRHLRVSAPMGTARRFDYGVAVALSTEMPVRAVAARLKTTPPAVWRALRVMRRGYP
ncbi:hypothetical protein ADL19_19620 [Streptomyces purpurogeneiscleroticus]|nr:hypothetical protein ADL19_19620 [Streptomyces purpurogeneiscleroticus]